MACATACLDRDDFDGFVRFTLASADFRTPWPRRRAPHRLDTASACPSLTSSLTPSRGSRPVPNQFVAPHSAAEVERAIGQDVYCLSRS